MTHLRGLSRIAIVSLLSWGCPNRPTEGKSEHHSYIGPDAGDGLPDAGVDEGPDAAVLDGGDLDGGMPDAGTSDAGGLDVGDDGGLTDWLVYRGDPLGHSDVDIPLTVAQGATLTNVWTYQRTGGTAANPIVADGVVYFAWTDGTLRAVDMQTGDDLWAQSIGILAPAGCEQNWDIPIGAPAVVGGRIFASGGDGAVYALDRASGNQLWRTPVASETQNETLWASIFPLNGRVYVGVGTLDEDNCPLAVGRFVSLDQSTGDIAAAFWVDHQNAGGGVWTQPVFDELTNRILIATGNGLSGEPYGQAVVALDPSTLDVLDSYQIVVSNPDEDYDFGASPTLVDLPDGSSRLVIVTNKDGVVYALDHADLAAGPVWQYQVCLPGTSPDDGQGSIVSAAFAHGLVFVAGGQTSDGSPGIVAALDPATGTPQWTMHPDGFVLPALLAVGDILVATSTHADMTGRIYVLDQSSGVSVVTFPTPGQLFSPPSFAEGTLLEIHGPAPVENVDVKGVSECPAASWMPLVRVTW
jgi:outer membrane protein assembly factor BamB